VAQVPVVTTDEQSQPDFETMTEDERARMLAGGSGHLAKATWDSFDFACQTVTGAIIYFEHATLNGEWVTLHEIKEVQGLPERYPGKAWSVPSFDRGVDIRREHIVWIADAPNGS